MSISLARSSISSVAAAAVTATCAAVGVAFLVFETVGAPLPLVTIPAGALLLTRAMVTRGNTRDGHGGGVLTAPRSAATAPAALDSAFAERFLAAEFAAAQRGRRLALVVFRIDNLARTGALYEGSSDGLQIAVAHLLRRCTRAMNLSTRDETRPGTFISILSDSSVEGAARFVQKVRREMTAIKAGGAPVGLSAGIALFDYSMSDPRDLRRAAELAADRATRDGGNRVVVISSTART